MQHKTRETARRAKRAPLLAFLMLALALCLAPSAAYAGPALEIEQGYVQPDGATFQAGQRGDRRQLMTLAEKYDVEYDGWGTYYEDPNGEDGDDDDEEYVDEDDDGVRH